MGQFCPHCGTRLSVVVDAFCPECRNDLDESPTPASLPQVAPAQAVHVFSEVIGAEGMSLEELAAEIAQGGRLVVYEYCVSVVWLTFLRRSKVHLVRAGQSARLKGLEYTLLSLLVGWWGIPWGFIYTPRAVITNLRGGEDVTAALVNYLPPERAI